MIVISYISVYVCVLEQKIYSNRGFYHKKLKIVGEQHLKLRTSRISHSIATTS